MGGGKKTDKSLKGRAIYQKKYRARLKKAGFRQMTVLAHRDDEQRIRLLARRLYEQRKEGSGI